MIRSLLLCGLCCVLTLQAGQLPCDAGPPRPARAISADEWKAGFAKVAITPEQPMFASGYGSRDKPSDGKIHDLYARVAALRDPAGRTAVFVALDLIGVPPGMAEEISRALDERHGIARADVMFTCSHTHCGPALDDRLSHMLPLSDADWKRVRSYQKRLNASLLAAIDDAIKDLRPARLFAGTGRTGFAVNRRKPIGKGPTDHDVPVLRITSADGSKLCGAIYGYACHNTVLSFYEWCGDYAGFASLFLEDRHPGAVALFFSGCGADQNPLPRRKVELAEKYGRMLAEAVEQTIAGRMLPVRGRLRTAFRTIDLEFESLPTREQLDADLKSSNRFVRARAAFLLKELETNGELAKTYPYPVQVWQLGDAALLIALGGEVVVDYSLRLKKEFGGKNVWVAGYANDVMGYIPSERILSEGGYEGGGSMLYYQQPSNWKAGLEQQIVAAVKEMVRTLNSR